MMTAVQAAGECPWPGSAMGLLMGLLRRTGADIRAISV